MNNSDSIRILVVDDQELIRQGIATLLSLEEGIVVVGQADSGETAVSQATALKPDLILMDIRMPGMDGVEAVQVIRQQQPTCKVLMLTTFNDDHYIIKSLQAGATGYLLKDMPSHDLAQAIRLAHAGIYQLAPDVAGKLVGNISQPHGPNTTPPQFPSEKIPVTLRELDVLRLLASGASNKEIALQLSISEGTVKKHISNILQTLDLRDRTQAAIYAVKHNLA
ncbi:MAG: response regulator transcription factor [Chloroflexota bacterium]